LAVTHMVSSFVKKDNGHFIVAAPLSWLF